MKDVLPDGHVEYIPWQSVLTHHLSPPVEEWNSQIGAYHVQEHAMILSMQGISERHLSPDQQPFTVN